MGNPNLQNIDLDKLEREISVERRRRADSSQVKEFEQAIRAGLLVPIACDECEGKGAVDYGSAGSCSECTNGIVYAVSFKGADRFQKLQSLARNFRSGTP